MPAKQYRLLTVAQAYTITERLAKMHGCSMAAIRVLAVLSELDTTLYRIGIKDVINVLACHYDTAEIGLKDCVALGWLDKHHKRHVYYVPTVAGCVVADSLRRAEKSARLQAAELKPTKLRKYVKRIATGTTK